MVTVMRVPALTLVTAPAARAFSVFSPTSMLPVNSVRPHSFTMFAEISASRMMVVSCWQGLIPVQFLAMAVSTENGQQLFDFALCWKFCTLEANTGWRPSLSLGSKNNTVSIGEGQ